MIDENLLALGELLKKERSLPFLKKEEYMKLLERRVKRCKRCALSLTRKNVVVGEGNLDAELMFIGEAPGEEEDLTGRPFVGRAGQLLTRIIQAMGLRREDVYIGNILKCRPPNNRDPLPHEMENCLPYLFLQLEIIKPKIIVLLGRIAGMALFGKDFSLGQERGKFLKFRDIKVMPTFHPSYLLRNPQAKRLVWEDIKKVMKEMGLPIPKR